MPEKLAADLTDIVEMITLTLLKDFGLKDTPENRAAIDNIAEQMWEEEEVL